MNPRWSILALSILVAASCPAAESSSKRLLIIHADDAGMSHSVNRATIDAMEKGLVTSASIMVPCPWFLEFAEYASKHPERCYGIHLTLNSEWDRYRWGPVASRDQVPSLIDPEGYLWDSVEQVAANAKAEEVRTELRAQIHRARKFGVPLSHLDTHMGALVSRPDLLQVYVDVGLEFDLPILFLRKMDPGMAMAYPVLAQGIEKHLARLTQRDFPVLDHLLQFYDGNSHDERRARYVDAIRGLKPGLTELIIHCGYDNEELKAITNSSPRRDGDRRIFTELEIGDLIRESGIELTSWKALWDEAKRKK